MRIPCGRKERPPSLEESVPGYREVYPSLIRLGTLVDDPASTDEDKLPVIKWVSDLMGIPNAPLNLGITTYDPPPYSCLNEGIICGKLWIGQHTGDDEHYAIAWSINLRQVHTGNYITLGRFDEIDLEESREMLKQIFQAAKNRVMLICGMTEDYDLVVLTRKPRVKKLTPGAYTIHRFIGGEKKVIYPKTLFQMGENLGVFFGTPEGELCIFPHPEEKIGAMFGGQYINLFNAL